MTNINLSNTTDNVLQVPENRNWNYDEHLRYSRFRMRVDGNVRVGALEELIDEFIRWDYPSRSPFESSPLYVLSGYYDGKSDCLSKCLHEPKHCSELRWVSIKPDWSEWDSDRKQWKEGTDLALLRQNLIQ